MIVQLSSVNCALKSIILTQVSMYPRFGVTTYAFQLEILLNFKVQSEMRFAWSSSRTLDFRPLIPDSKPGVFKSASFSSFISLPGARSVAHKTRGRY